MLDNFSGTIFFPGKLLSLLIFNKCEIRCLVDFFNLHDDIHYRFL